MNPENLVVILVRPQGPINIGSVCRGMMNFGFNRLRLVDPTTEYLSLDAKKMALTAFPVLENAQVFDDLSAALADVQVAFGTTRRFGKHRKDFFTPSAAAQKMEDSFVDIQCALVLGPEDTGLETHDLNLCQHFITIPTHDAFPSMNLSHALSIMLYEIALKSRTDNPSHDPAPKNLAPGVELETMFAHMRQTMLDIDFLDPQNPDHILRTFRRIFGTVGLTSRDIKIIQGLMSRIDWTEDQRRKNAHVHNG